MSLPPAAARAKHTPLFDAHVVRDHRHQESDRAFQRAVLCLGIASVWAARWLSGAPIAADAWFVALISFVLPVLALAHGAYLLRHEAGSVALLYVFLVVDPLVLVGVLVEDPRTFAFLNPFVFISVVRTGIQYGVRTLYASWLVTLAASSLLFMSDYWKDETELSFAYLLMLLFVPVFFASLVRRMHAARAIEAERARFATMHEVLLARSAFLAKVSHELRSPLQGIVSALDVLELKQRREQRGDEEIIHRIRRSSLLLNTHLQDLLTLAKGEAGRLQLRPEAFEARTLVESVASAARDLASAKHLRLEIDIPSEDIFVVADSARIDQILTNLVVNSIRYTHRGRVRLSLRPYDEARRALRFEVADTGPGLSPKLLPSLLQPDTASTGNERRGEGSGIGLAIVRTLVGHLGGKVEVTSELGSGTSFTLLIPAEQVRPEAQDTTPSGSIGRVLVVDDRDDVLAGLTSVIEELGFECDGAVSAAAGANLLALRRYDAVLIDLEMPLKSGPAIAAETKQGDGPNAHTRLIGMSAGEPDDALTTPFDVCVTKPISHASLRQLLLGPGEGARPSQPGLWSER